MLLQYLKLIRIHNLLFIALIQYVIHQFVLVPVLHLNQYTTNDHALFIFLLIGATVLIAGGGNVINDYFDVKIDAINKPDKQLVGKFISRSNAMLLHQILTFSGLATGLLLSWMLKSGTLALVFLGVPGLLWFYSASYKRQFMIGNIIIAMLGGLSILMLGMTEVAAIRLYNKEFLYSSDIARIIYGWTGGFALFAFLLHWIREVVKDMEDVVGDREMECRTMPIKWGVTKTKIFILTLLVITVFLLIYLHHLYIPFDDSLSMRYILIGVILPLCTLAIMIIKSNTPSGYHQTSGFVKFIMLTGLMYAFIVYFLFAKEYGLSFFNHITIL